MKKTVLTVAILMALLAAYYGFWRYQLADDVARVEVTIAHHNSEFRKHNRWVTLKSDGVRPVGFPFAARVRVDRPTITFVWGKETYGISLPWAELQLRDAASGTYALTYAPSFEAVYAQSGAAPEEYGVTPTPTLNILLRAQGDSRACPPMPSTVRCAEVAAEAPLITYAVELPSQLTLRMALGDKTRDAAFTLMPLPVPIYRHFPVEVDRPVELFVGMLREALVFRK